MGKFYEAKCLAKHFALWNENIMWSKRIKNGISKLGTVFLKRKEELFTNFTLSITRNVHKKWIFMLMRKEIYKNKELNRSRVKELNLHLLKKTFMCLQKICTSKFIFE